MINLKRYGEWIFVLVTIVAASGWLFSKEAIAGMPPFGFVGLRFLLASIVLFPLCLGTHQTISLAHVPKAALAGLLLTININLWIFAISSNGALGEGAFIMSLSILMVPLISWFLFKDKPLTIFWLSLPIAMVGLACLSLSSGWNFSISQLWFFLSALAYAVYFNFNSRFVQKIAVLPLACIQLFTTGMISFLLSLLLETWPDAISWSTLSWFLSSVLIATSFRYLLQTVGQKYVNVGNAAIIMILEPIFTLFLGIIIYHEPMPLIKWIGCALILFALFIYRGYLFVRMRRSRLYNQT